MAEFIHSDPVVTAITNSSYFKNIQISMVCPKEGTFIGWKCTYYYGNVTQNGFRPVHPALVKLEIPEDARRSSFGRKCRCDKAKVLGIETFDGKPLTTAYSFYDNSFVYEVGKTVSVPNFDENRWHECAPGIHFFMTEKEARRYVYC